MKIFRYLVFILTILIVAAVAYFGFTKMENKENTILSPLVEMTTKEISSFSIEKAPTESLRGEIVSMTGKIEWQDRVATEAAKLLTPTIIQQGEKLITGKESSLSLRFSDACLVEFLEKTEVEIIQTLPEHIVFLHTTGTARYIKTGNYPVSVRVKHLLVENDGQMTVSIDSEESIITLNLKTGKAIVAFNDIDYQSHEVLITAGETFEFNDDTRIGVLE